MMIKCLCILGFCLSCLTLAMPDLFQSISVRDIDVESCGQSVDIQVKPVLCSLFCVIEIGDRCRGFHIAPNGACFLFVKPCPETKRSTSIVVWLRVGNADVLCPKKQFAYDFGRSRYHYSTLVKKWLESQAYCRSRNAKLSEMTNVIELNHLVEVVKTQPNNNVTGYASVGMKRMKNCGDTLSLCRPRIFWVPSKMEIENEKPFGILDVLTNDMDLPYGAISRAGKLTMVKNHAMNFICECLVI